jgi:hypothetical protein
MIVAADHLSAQAVWPGCGSIFTPVFAAELDFLKGRAKFPEYDVFSLLHYDE